MEAFAEFRIEIWNPLSENTLDVHHNSCDLGTDRVGNALECRLHSFRVCGGMG